MGGATEAGMTQRQVMWAGAGDVGGGKDWGLVTKSHDDKY